MQLSNRLAAVADMVSRGNRLVDVGTDHGYLPIYLIENGQIPSAIALDINKGPIQRAKEHIKEHNLERYIDTRLSDGVTALNLNEGDTLVIAGMGGGLVIKILTEGESILSNFREFILQPQSELEQVRKFLIEKGYHIVKENMILEEGKYYPMMKVVKTLNSSKCINNEKEEIIRSLSQFVDSKCEDNSLNEKYDKTIYYKFGKELLENRNEVLKSFLIKELITYSNILEKISINTQENVILRKNEIKDEINDIKEALLYYEM